MHRTVLMLLLSVVAAPPLLPQNRTNYVTVEGSAAPEADQRAKPWQSIEAAVRAMTRDGGVVMIAPGIYRETFSIRSSGDPVRLTAPDDDVVIGSLSRGVTAQTTFHVLTWNTHLAGDQVGMPSWQDGQRAGEIGRYLALTRDEIDVVSLCEVWDDDLFHGQNGIPGIRALAGYRHGYHGERIDQQSEGCVIPLPPYWWRLPTSANSGLAMMSKRLLREPKQVSFMECEGSCLWSKSPDCLASKGFISATIEKDSFAVRVYNTHAQAANDPDYVEARVEQMKQIAADVQLYRLAHPGHAVFVMGDLNVIGESEQYPVLEEQFGTIGGRDAHRNVGTESMYNDHRVGHTYLRANHLAVKFDEEAVDQRLDYVWYFPSLDGSVRIQPVRVVRLTPVGSTKTEDGFTSAELSDHYPIRADFRLFRVR